MMIATLLGLSLLTLGLLTLLTWKSRQEYRAYRVSLGQAGDRIEKEWKELQRSNSERNIAIGQMLQKVLGDLKAFDDRTERQIGQVSLKLIQMDKRLEALTIHLEPVPPHAHEYRDGRCVIAGCGEWWTGAFLPTEEAAATIERQLHEAEDHAVSATEPIRYSSRPSGTSARPSAREPSTQRGKTSGNR